MNTKFIYVGQWEIDDKKIVGRLQRDNVDKMKAYLDTRIILQLTYGWSGQLPFLFRKMNKKKMFFFLFKFNFSQIKKNLGNCLLLYTRCHPFLDVCVTFSYTQEIGLNTYIVIFYHQFIFHGMDSVFLGCQIH